MIPEELQDRVLQLPSAENHSIVVITGAALRHDRFALRIQEEFGDAVVGWIQVLRPHKEGERPTPSGAHPSQRLASMARTQRQVEQHLFGEEVMRLRRMAHLQPRSVDDPNSPDIVDYLRSLEPYFLLTLGGAIYEKPLRECAKGVALNQHDGWCPTYRGTSTVDWALYHRDICHLGNTVHILTGGMDAGPILRRSTACLVPEDTPMSCFVRSVALGTELMCEVVHEITRSKRVTIYEQPPEMGFTYVRTHLDQNIKQSIDRDFQAGWLPKELARLRQF